MVVALAKASALVHAAKASRYSAQQVGKSQRVERIGVFTIQLHPGIIYEIGYLVYAVVIAVCLSLYSIALPGHAVGKGFIEAALCCIASLVGLVKGWCV